MIFIDRDRLDNGQPIRPLGDWMQHAQTKTADAIREKSSHVVTNLYRSPSAKAALEKLFYNKCAYCESAILTAPWDVEHFRPKGSVAEDKSHPGYYWLAYTWTNLYPSCLFCNQRRKDQPTYDNPTLGPAVGKLDHFPIEGVRARGPGDCLADEKPLLIDPCSDQPDIHLTFDVTGDLAPRAGSKKGETTIKIFGLNGRKRLHNARVEVLRHVTDKIDEFVAEGYAKNDATKKTLDYYCSKPDQQYLALINAIREDPARFGI